MAQIKIAFATTTKGRLLAVDELKGLAIIMVVLYHSGGVLALNNRWAFDLGVDIFVIISGINLARSSREESPWNFLRRRFFRILPAYWIILTVVVLLGFFVLGRSYSLQDLLLHYLGIHGWFGDHYTFSINDSFWFITLVLSLYGFYAFAQRWRERQEILMMVGSVMTIGPGLILFYTGQFGSFGHIGLRLPDFLIGLLIGQLLREGEIRMQLGPPLAVILLVLVYIPYLQHVIFFTGIAALAIMVVYIFVWKRLAPPTGEKPIARGLRFLGAHSLEIFLIHQPFIREYNLYLQKRWLNDAQPSRYSLTIGIALGLAATLLLSIELRRLLGRIPGPRFRFGAKA